MDYEKEFVKGIGREDISITRNEFQKDLADQTNREEPTAKYGVFIRGILNTLIGKKRIPSHVDSENLIHEFLIEKFPKVIQSYEKEKGFFRAYLKTSFINYLIDRLYKNEKEQLWKFSFEKLQPTLSTENVQEQKIYEEYDQECFRELFQALDHELSGNTEIQKLLEYYKNQERENASLFSLQDFCDFPHFLHQIEQAEDPVSQYIWEHFTLTTRELLDEFIETQQIRKMLQRMVIRELNTLLRDDCFYSPKRFAHLSLPDAVLNQIKQDPEGKSLNQLNRLLLEIAYPKDIAKSPKKRKVKEFTKHQRKKAEEFLKKKALKIMESFLTPGLQQRFFSTKAETEENLKYFLKLYFQKIFLEKSTFDEE